MAEAIQQNSNNGHILASGKTTKLLNGVNKFSLQAWSRIRMREPVLETFIILDSNKNATTSFKLWKINCYMCNG